MAMNSGGRGGRASREVWARRVGEWRRSGVSASRFCRGRGFAVSTFRWWAWRLGSSGEAAAECAGLVRIEVDAPEPACSPVPFEIVLPDGIEIRVVSGFNADALRRLLYCVEARRRC